MTVDLVRCIVASPHGDEISFTLAEDRRVSLLEGLDETSLILRHEHEIDAYQTRLRREQPWVFRGEGNRMGPGGDSLFCRAGGAP